MSLLSKQAETKLIGAIEAAAALVNTGMAPDDAIIKSATDAGIPPGHIDLMVHAYNTGRTTKQREQGENTLEKAADFTLADVEAIRAKMFNTNVKTSAEIRQQQVVSEEYAVHPAAMIKRATKRAAQSAPAFTPTFVPPPRDEHEVARPHRAPRWGEVQHGGVGAGADDGAVSGRPRAVAQELRLELDLYPTLRDARAD